jgi:hypothetical protein
VRLKAENVENLVDFRKFEKLLISLVYRVDFVCRSVFLFDFLSEVFICCR